MLGDVNTLVKLGYTFPAIVNRLTDMGMKFAPRKVKILERAETR